MILFLKAACLCIYALALVGWAGGLLAGFSHSMQTIALAMLFIHVAELVFAFKHVRRYQGSMARSILLTLLFGVLHWKPLTRLGTPQQQPL